MQICLCNVNLAGTVKGIRKYPPAFYNIACAKKEIHERTHINLVNGTSTCYAEKGIYVLDV